MKPLDRKLMQESKEEELKAILKHKRIIGDLQNSLSKSYIDLNKNSELKYLDSFPEYNLGNLSERISRRFSRIPPPLADRKKASITCPDYD
jgi:hypothetical protein